MPRSLELIHLAHLGRPSQLITAALAGRDATTHIATGELLWSSGRFDELLPHVRLALHAGPRTTTEWGRLIRLMQNVTLQASDVIFRPRLIEALESEGIDTDALVGHALAILFHERSASGAGDEAFLDDPLLHAILRRTVVADLHIELALTAMRTRLLNEPALRRDHRPFLSALAIQCFNNEYAWLESSDERHAIAKLESRARKTTVDELLMLACYRPLHRIAGADALLRRQQPEEMRAVLERQLVEPREEAALKTHLWRNAPSDDPTSTVVRAQYESNPFPRWITVEAQEPLSLADHLQASFPHLNVPAFLRKRPAVLIAGTGTGRHAILRAQRHPEVRMLAVDLSTSSLAYGARRARELGISNVDFQQADILTLPGDRPSFHVVECVGVLNCFEDPLAGWRKLTRLVVPGGLMCIALYSWHARHAVRAVWSLLSKSTREMDPDDMRAARRVVIELPDDHPVKSITRSPDFYSLSGCRDLLFHVQELQFTLPQIAGMLDELGLRFVGFELSHPYVGVAYEERFPDDPARTDLSRWDVFEREHPEIFSGMYQFWCQKL